MESHQKTNPRPDRPKEAQATKGRALLPGPQAVPISPPPTHAAHSGAHVGGEKSCLETTSLCKAVRVLPAAAAASAKGRGVLELWKQCKIWR